MNTKYALFALCLPFAFAACQNEEIVKNPSLDLESRGQVDLVVSANYPGGMVDSRMSATESNNALSFLWEKGTDVLGAAMMDGVALGTVDNASIFANYPFEAQNSGANATFASPSSVTKGIYMFYNSYVDILDRGSLKIYLADQEYDPTSSKTSAQQMVNYMNMVSPLVNLNAGITLADAAEFVLPLEFANLYTPVKVPVVFKNAPEGTTLKKISITTNYVDEDNLGGFTLGGVVNDDVVESAGILTLKDGAIDEEKLSVADAVEALDAAIQTNSLYEDDDKKVVGPATLTIKDGVAMTNGTAKEFWVLIPRGTYSNLAVIVETSNGVMEPKQIEVPASIEGNTDAKPQEFTSATRSLSNVEVNFGEGGNVSQPNTFAVSSTAEWNNAVQYVMEHITSYVGGEVVFNIPADKKVYVTSLPDFGFELTTGSKAALVLGNADGSEATVSLKNNKITTAGANIMVGAGATVNMTKDITGAVITNTGILNVNLAAVTASIVNNGTMNINMAGTVLTSLVNDNVVNVKADATLQATSFVNQPKYDGNGNYVREGVINVAEDAAFEVAGGNNATIVNKGTVELTGTFANNGKIDNFGTLKTAGHLTNNNLIIAEDGSKSDGLAITNTTGVVEVINPETWVTLQANASTKYNITGGSTTAVVSNRKAFLAAASMDITLSAGDWNIVASGSTPGESSRDLLAAEIPEEISLKGNLIVKATADLSATTFNAVGTTTITTNKDVVFTVGVLNVAKDAAATISTGSKLTVKASGNVVVDGKLTNNGAIEAVATEILTAANSENTMNMTVNPDGTLVNAKGANIGAAVNGKAAVVVTGNVTNSGTIYGTLNTNDAKTAVRGTIKNTAAKTSAVDLSAFTSYSAIEATGDVTAIPEEIPVTFTSEVTGLTLSAGEYGALTFNENAAISASEENAVIAKITVAANKELTVDPSSETIICKAVTKNTGAEITTNDKLVKEDGTTVWTW